MSKKHLVVWHIYHDVEGLERQDGKPVTRVVSLEQAQGVVRGFVTETSELARKFREAGELLIAEGVVVLAKDQLDFEDYLADLRNDRDWGEPK